MHARSVDTKIRTLCKSSVITFSLVYLQQKRSGTRYYIRFPNLSASRGDWTWRLSGPRKRCKIKVFPNLSQNVNQKLITSERTDVSASASPLLCFTLFILFNDIIEGTMYFISIYWVIDSSGIWWTSFLWSCFAPSIYLLIFILFHVLESFPKYLSNTSSVFKNSQHKGWFWLKSKSKVSTPETSAPVSPSEIVA